MLSSRARAYRARAPALRSAEARSLAAGVGEEQVVGNVLVAGRPLLRQVVGPPEQLQHRPDQVLLGDRLVGLRGSGEGLVPVEDGLAEGGEGLRVSGRGLPLGGGLVMPSVRK